MNKKNDISSSTLQEDKHLQETMLETHETYRGHMLTLQRDRVRLPDGSESMREWVVHPGAATILPFVTDHQLIMVKQFRYPLGKVFLELPAGKLSIDELPLLAAQRELEEETGYRSKQWELIGQCHPCIGYADETIYYFTAKNLSFHQACPDEGEWVDTITMDVSAVLNAIRDGHITDSKTITGMMLALQKNIL